MLVYSIHLWYWTSIFWLTPVRTRYPLTSITWPYRGLKLKLTEVSCYFFLSWPLTRYWFSMGLQAQPRWTYLNISDASYFCALSVARPGYKAILYINESFYIVKRFSCSGGKRFGRCFLSAFFAGFNPVWHIMKSVFHTGGYAVIQVRHRRDVNLKLSVYF